MVRGTECSLPINGKVKSNHRYPKILDHERLKMKNKFLRTSSYFKRSKHLLVLKMSSRRFQDIPSRSFQHVFRVTTLSWRRLQDALKTFLEDVLNACPEGVLKTCLEESWIHYGDKQNSYSGHLYLTNLNVFLTNLYFANLYLTVLR